MVKSVPGDTSVGWERIYAVRLSAFMNRLGLPEEARPKRWALLLLPLDHSGPIEPERLVRQEGEDPPAFAVFKGDYLLGAVMPDGRFVPNPV